MEGGGEIKKGEGKDRRDTRESAPAPLV